MKIYFSIIASISISGALALAPFGQQNHMISMYGHATNPYYQFLTQVFSKFNITFQAAPAITTNDDNLYILFDVHTLHLQQLPKYYIVYQTIPLSRTNINSNFINTLSRSIVVWDSSRDNIALYKDKIHNYHYFPLNYEFIDPIILPCLLSPDGWNLYKELVTYENQKNTDITSHVPTLLCYALLQEPKIILELGVRGGESTIPLYKAAGCFNTFLIGVDIAPDQNVYTHLKNAFFFQINDLDFPQLFSATYGSDKKCDIIFIDTSHEYDHTLQEITQFVPLLSEQGFIAFHDSNVTPLANSGYVRLNGTHDGAPGNTRGVTRAIKEYFSLEFDEYKYCNIIFSAHDSRWHMVHYPFCNGLTLIKKLAA